MRLSRMLAAYTEALDELPNINSFSAPQLRKWLMTYRAGANADVSTLEKEGAAFVESLRKQKRDGYAELIARSVKRVTAIIGKDTPLQVITPSMMEQVYIELSNDLSPTTVGMHLRDIRTLLNKAKREGRVRYDIDPFVSVRIPTGTPRDLSITVEELRRVRDADLSGCARKRIARDLFMLSFYLGGANLRDILDYNFKTTDVFDYTRHKTRNMKQGEHRVVLSVQPEARAIIKKYLSRETGRLHFPYKYDYENFKRYMTRLLRAIGDDLGIERLVFYSARHTFAQLAFDLGISLEVMEYCMGQSVKANRPIYNYVKIMRRHGDEAMRKVIGEVSKVDESR